MAHRRSVTARFLAMVTLVVTPWGVAGCSASRASGQTPTTAPRRAPSTSPVPTTLAHIGHAVLTADAPGSLDFVPVPDGVTVRVPTGAGGLGLREVFWVTGSSTAADQQACIRWDDVAFPEHAGDPTQPGLALRIAPAGEGQAHTRAVSINQNIWSAASWVIWVNTWDTARVDRVNAPVEAFDVSAVVGRRFTDETGWHDAMIGGPWYVCARTKGLDLTFKVWTHQEPEPGWDDPTHVFHTTLPEGWDHSGYSGGYIGHLREGQTATFSGLRSSPR